jgi:hypothetical protein
MNLTCSLQVRRRLRGIGHEGGGGQGEKRGERGWQETCWRLLSGQKERGERQTAKYCPVSNCTHDMYSTPVDLSFSYLRSAVEASLDIKKVQMEPNRDIIFLNYFMSHFQGYFEWARDNIGVKKVEAPSKYPKKWPIN